MREGGLAMLLVASDFKTGALRRLNATTELLQDKSREAGKTRMLLLRVPDATIDSLLTGVAKEPGVIAVSKSYVRAPTTNDPYWNGQQAAGLRTAFLDYWWALFGTGNAGVKVAVVDSGVNEIPDLSGKLEAGINFIDPQTPDDTSDTVGHGTEVASIIAASTNNGIGIAGIAPNVHVVPVKACVEAFPGSGSTLCPDRVLEEALNWAANEAGLGAIDVVNLSVSGPDNNPVIDYHLARLEQYDAITVAAAGNDGASVYFPARSSHVVAVAGTAPNGGRDPNSNYGPEIDVAAPYQTYSLDKNNFPVYVEGTSFSTPVIAGLAALYKSAIFVGYAHMAQITVHQSYWSADTGNGVPNYLLWNGYVENFSCATFDFNKDSRIDVADEQMIAARYGSYFGSPIYEARFDLDPHPNRDGDVDIKDLQRVFGRDGFHCR